MKNNQDFWFNGEQIADRNVLVSEPVVTFHSEKMGIQQENLWIQMFLILQDKTNNSSAKLHDIGSH